MNWDHISEYNRDQWNSFKAIEKTCRGLPEAALAKLKESLASYLHFRKRLDSYQQQYFGSFCRTTCFDSKLSACCGFESIYTFFADQVITFLLATPEEHEALLRRLAQPNKTERCVYLGERGCAWKVSPISCAMFFCEQAKETVFSEHHPAQALWEELQRQEKAYTYPNQPVLFDDHREHLYCSRRRFPHHVLSQEPRVAAGKGSVGSWEGGFEFALLADYRTQIYRRELEPSLDGRNRANRRERRGRRESNKLE